MSKTVSRGQSFLDRYSGPIILAADLSIESVYISTTCQLKTLDQKGAMS